MNDPFLSGSFRALYPLLREGDIMTRMPIWIALAVSFLAGAVVVHFALDGQWQGNEIRHIDSP